MRILIVEDERHLAEALRQIMLEQKYKADIVYDGEDGFEYAMSNAYDAIILDIMLPGQNGFEVVRKLRAEKNNVPIVLGSATPSVETYARAQKGIYGLFEMKERISIEIINEFLF